MGYIVKITLYAITQIQETIAYISKVLLEPEIAKAWSDHLKNEIKSLNVMPARFPLVEREPWRTNGIRRMTVKNLMVYYYSDDENKTVWIIAVVYSRRDQLDALKEMPY